jgi:hypothetical protein
VHVGTNHNQELRTNKFRAHFLPEITRAMDIESCKILLNKKIVKINEKKELLVRWRTEIREKKLIERVDGETATLPVVFLSYLKSMSYGLLCFLVFILFHRLHLFNSSK